MPDGRRTGSVRFRITAVATVVVLVVLVAMAVLVVVTQRQALTEQLDDALEVDAERLALTAATGELPVLDDDDDRLVAILVGGAVVASTEDLDPDEQRELIAADEGAASIGGDAVRVARADGDGVDVVVAASIEDLDETVAALVRTLLLVVPAAVLVLAVLVWLLVGRTLRPVERIRAEVATIGLDELDRRVPQPAGSDEIARLAATMNEMLARLDRANQRQQRFVGDAAHELRTPLTRLRADLEVSDRDPDSDPEAVRRAALDDVATLQHLIDDLLLLARTDAAASPVRRLVDLDDLVLDEARAVGEVDVTAVSAAQVLGDPAALKRVVRNLLDNASRHSSSQVSVALSETDGTARLVVEDDGPGIPVEHRVDVFERFRRLDDARTPADGRSGLGLAIVSSVVGQHGGTVEVGVSASGGARLIVCLPLGDR